MPHKKKRVLSKHITLDISTHCFIGQRAATSFKETNVGIQDLPSFWPTLGNNLQLEIFIELKLLLFILFYCPVFQRIKNLFPHCCLLSK